MITSKKIYPITILCVLCLLAGSAPGAAARQKATAPQDSIKTHYQKAYHQILGLLEDPKPGDFKRAVLAVEDAWMGGQLNREAFQQQLDLLTGLARQVIGSRKLEYSGPDKPIVEIHAGLFTVMTDTLQVRISEDRMVAHPPFRYDFTDVFGRRDWRQMFVSKLLAARTGNCHSLPYLYKILAEEMGATARLAQAPNHLYIRLRNAQTGWYNTELTSGQFPVDGWLMASGFVGLDAIRNGLYMAPLTQKQSLALTLVDLAKGYQRKTGGADPDFTLNIVNTALEHHPNGVSALLLKAETLKRNLQGRMEAKQIHTLGDIEEDTGVAGLFGRMQVLYGRIHKLGYRHMPEAMYREWLQSLVAEADKYQNKSLPYGGN